MLKDTGERLILNENWNLKTKLEHIHRYTAASELLKGKVVLDAACGSGYGSAILSQKAQRVTGVDLSKDAIDFAREQFHKDNLEYFQMSIGELAFPDHCFDAVVSFETIEHVEKEVQELFLEQVIRVLKPDGLFIVSTPNDELLRKLTFGQYQNPFHVCEFAEDEFDMMLKKYFKYTSFFYQTVSIASMILKKDEDFHTGEVYGNNVKPEMERFYIALCSNVPFSQKETLDSAMRPDIEDYYDERYFTREAQAFIDIGNGFDGKIALKAKCHCYDGKTFSFHFEIKGIEGVKAVRFDPLEHACIVRIDDVRSNIEGLSVRPVNAEISMNGVETFTTMDPIYLLEGEGISDIEYFDISGEILNESPDYIAWNRKEKQLEDANQKIQDLSQQIINSNKKTQEFLQQITDLNKEIQSLRQAHIENVDTTVKEQVENIHHTVNDMLYVFQHTVWYQKAMKRVRRGPALWWIIRQYGLIGVCHRGIEKLFSQIYRGARKSKTLYSLLQKIYVFAAKISPNLKRRLDRIVWNAMNEVDGLPENNSLSNEVEQCDLPISQMNPLVSIIVPNYNHARFLRQRLDSIYSQTYHNYEVILLDDCSTDESRAILEEYAHKYSDNTICSFNEKNVGKVNLQWNKGLSLAKGEYIWIAESDDWCEPNFLETLVPKLQQQSVMIAFARSIFMEDGHKIWSTEEYLYDVQMKWNKPFTMTGYEAVQRGFAEKNFIPNVSSAIFRNTGKIPDEVMDIWANINLCGDWIFYLYLVKGGAFSYTNETTNYYRIHKGSTSLKVQRTSAYYEESEIVSCYVARNYKVEKKVFENTLKVLQKHYIENGYGTNPNDVCKWYRLERIFEAMKERYPNVLMCNYAMKMGGGEIFPIHLANALRRKGLPVTFLDCQMEKCDIKVRKMLDAVVPLIELRTPMALKIAAKAFGAEIVHSHHGSVDKLVSEILRDDGYKQIITLHGMYEAIDKSDLIDLLHCVTETCSVFAYIADKNLEPFKQYGYFEKCNFVKMENGLFSGCPKAIERKSLGIPEDAFVLCLVSRARFDKGWVEAAHAVIDANKNSARSIHLILVGDGEAYEEVCKISSPFIHAVGEKQNPRAYFATADMGFLPSRFQGESFPLTVIESLMCGRPVLASNIGEISNQITLPDGRKAGALFELQDGQIPVDTLGKMICQLASDSDAYQKMKKCVPEAAEKFDINIVAKKYSEIYKKCYEDG